MLMSKAAYAKHRGVSRQTVYDWIARGEIVVSGNKIDVTATEYKEQAGATNDVAYLTLSATQVAEWIHANQDKYPAAKNQDEARRYIEIAVKLISYDVEFLFDDEGDEAVRIYFDDEEHFFYGFHQLESAMYFIRDTLYAECLNAKLSGYGDDIDHDDDRWPVAELIAICTPLETEAARIERHREVISHQRRSAAAFAEKVSTDPA